MSTIRVRRGLEANRLSFTPAVGEPVFTTDTKKLYVGDGSTPGGILVDMNPAIVPDLVLSVAGRVGNVVLTKADVGLSSADNTADVNKPVSIAAQAALDAKATIAALTAHASNTANPHSTNKAQVGLPDVDNVSAAALRDRSTHTGTQSTATIAGLDASLAGKQAAGSYATTTQLTDGLAAKAEIVHTHSQIDVVGLGGALNGKQATLVSGTNIKTINGTSVLGSGDIAIAGGGGLVDGDMGDITVSGVGTVLTVDNDVVTNAKAANMGVNTIKGRVTAGTGDPEDLTPANVRTIINVADGSTANSSDATLLARANHTGTQSADTLTDGTTNKAFLATERTKLAGVATGATANDTDANLKARANHTGTQAAATISDFSSVSDARIAAAAGVSVASLSGGKVPSSQLPALALTDVFSVASQVAQLALTAEEGDVAIRTDLNKSYIHNGGVAGTMADWSELLTPTDTVLSVNGETGAVTITTDDVSDVGQTNKWATAAEKTKLGFVTVTQAVDLDAIETNANNVPGIKTKTDFMTVTQAVNLDTMESDIALKATDSAVVHNTGNETVAGIKTFSSDPIIPDEAYGVGWDGSLEPATKNALYDKIQTMGGGAVTAQAEINFGTTEKADEVFNIVDVGISATSKIIAFVTWATTLGRDADEIMADPINISIEPKAGSMDIYAMARLGTVSGKYAINYQIG